MKAWLKRFWTDADYFTALVRGVGKYGISAFGLLATTGAFAGVNPKVGAIIAAASHLLPGTSVKKS